MSAPPKPWEISGAGDNRTFQMPASIDQNLLGQISGNRASQPTALLGPAPVAGQPQRRAPAAPQTTGNLRSQLYNSAPAVQSSLGSYVPVYPSTFASAYGNAYGNTYGSGLGTYGSTLGSYGSTLGSYGSTLGSYGSSYGSPYGGYGMGSGYGSYGQRYGGYGMPAYGGQPTTGPESRLVALAAERSRPTFESIESVVQTVGSVSFMLESTLGALHSSFRAVLAVADHLGRLRAIFSAMAVFRLARHLYARLLRLLGVAPAQSEEAAWGAAAVSADAPSGGSWPVAAFVAIVVAAPYIAFRLLAKLAPADIDPTHGAGVPVATNELPAWLSSGQPVWQGVSRLDFAPTGPGQLAVRANQPVFLAPQQMQTYNNGWVLASDGNSSGLVPKSYISIARMPAQSNNAAPRSRPAAASYAPTISPDSMEPTISPDPTEPGISPGPQHGQPDKETLAE